MTTANQKLLRLTISVNTDDNVEMAFVRALLTRLNILHARLNNGKLADLLGGRELSELYKKVHLSGHSGEHTSSNGMVSGQIEVKLLPAPQSVVQVDSGTKQRDSRWWRSDKSTVKYKILSIREQKMPMPASTVVDNETM